MDTSQPILQAGLDRLQAFHGNGVTQEIAARLKAIMVNLAGKRKRDGSDNDDDEDEREDTSKRPRMSPSRLLYQTLKTADSSDFWVVYFATTEKQRELIETKVMLRREDITIENYLQAKALTRALGRYDAEKRGNVSIRYFEIVPTYADVRAIYNTALESDDFNPVFAFNVCLVKLLEVSSLITLNLRWMYLTEEMFVLMEDHRVLRELVLENGVTASPNVNVGDWLEKLSLTKLQAPVRFSPSVFLSNRMADPGFLQQVVASKPWMLTSSGESRKFPSIRKLALVELDTHHAEELIATLAYALPIDRIIMHDNLNTRIAEIFPRLKMCVYDVVTTKQAGTQEPRVLVPEQLEVFPASCKEVNLSLRAATAIIQEDRDTAMLGRNRAVKTLGLFLTPFGNPDEVDGEGLVLSFPRTKELKVHRLEVISSSLRRVSRYYWREIREIPEWLMGMDLEKSNIRTTTGSLIDYRIMKLTSSQRTTIEEAVVKSSKTRKLVISSIEERDPRPTDRFLASEIPLPPNLETFVCINDVWFAENALAGMSDSTRASLRNVWLHQMRVSDINTTTVEVEWMLAPYELTNGLMASTLDRLHPDARVNGVQLASIDRR